MRNHLLKFALGALIVCVASATSFAQGRGRGLGRGRNVDVFSNGRDARSDPVNTRRRNQDWKCNVFVNCHDARDGRLDGRGPRVTSNRTFIGRGDRIGNRRYSTNDYWQRRHMVYPPRYNRVPRFR